MRMHYMSAIIEVPSTIYVSRFRTRWLLVNLHFAVLQQIVEDLETREPCSSVTDMHLQA